MPKKGDFAISRLPLSQESLVTPVRGEQMFSALFLFCLVAAQLVREDTNKMGLGAVVFAPSQGFGVAP